MGSNLKLSELNYVIAFLNVVAWIISSNYPDFITDLAPLML
jgi:hypothetical protein